MYDELKRTGEATEMIISTQYPAIHLVSFLVLPIGFRMYNCISYRGHLVSNEIRGSYVW
jgi:hypothetical protein